MSTLSIIVKNEYLTDIRSKSFWISTFIFPIVILAFGIFIAFLSDSSDSLQSINSPITPEEDTFTPAKAFGMMIGMFLTLFIMAYGANIFNKVKSEKTNRIVEIISTCVTGRTMMLAKVISVGLMGLTQMLIWGLLISGIILAFMLILPISIPIEYMFNSRLWIGFMWGIIYFIGGYTFFGSMFAAVGAMSDRNNENQEYITVITLILMGSFYIGMFAIDNVSSSLVQWCSYIPFTSPTVATVATLSGQIPLWQSILSVVILYLSAFITLLGAGKIYTSALLLRGKRLSPRDLLTFLRSK